MECLLQILQPACCPIRSEHLLWNGGADEVGLCKIVITSPRHVKWELIFNHINSPLAILLFSFITKLQ
jgi:hypothetical protein